MASESSRVEKDESQRIVALIEAAREKLSWVADAFLDADYEDSSLKLHEVINGLQRTEAAISLYGEEGRL